MGKGFLQILITQKMMLDSPLRQKMLIQLDVSHHFLFYMCLFHQSTSLLSLTSFFVSCLLAAEGFTTGRSYNIRIDDQVLLRFSPKNSDSTYYFGDMVLKFVLLQFLLCFDRVGYLSSMVADWWSTYLLSRNWKTEVPRGKGLSL
jgi:hypothetical protein